MYIKYLKCNNYKHKHDALTSQASRLLQVVLIIVVGATVELSWGRSTVWRFDQIPLCCTVIFVVVLGEISIIISTASYVRLVWLECAVLCRECCRRSECRLVAGSLAGSRFPLDNPCGLDRRGWGRWFRTAISSRKARSVAGTCCSVQNCYVAFDPADKEWELKAL